MIYNLLDYSLCFLLTYWIFLVIGVPVSGLLAGAGLTGLAIGLRAQGFLTDVINGIFILIEHQYDVRETIKVTTVTGRVTKVGLRTSQLSYPDGSLHFIPNRQITLVSNLSRDKRRDRIDFPFEQDHHPKKTLSKLILW
ncbi:mechanosensitive ion channel domain-containing protein [Streptococcus cuniculipharyngis]|uniref:Mechanosensitive ion channel n=1 Tax=Streptococcus cuniculipharyngis TaxID=1562651 RepID=A0A5C5SBT6_9STRE|nr:mechanosensitive ion channel domain-containing protein [Streptococcus cuniculipharyngis]TWS97382.1 mechanosensitive ion channel [Streptococcus cuniculipharyngis]